jgi:O-antigen ligase
MLCMVIIGLNPLAEKVKTIPATGDGDMARQFCYSLLFLIALFATQPVQYPKRLFTFPVSIFIAILYCWFTLTWSVVPSVGARRLTLTTIILFTIFRSVREIGYDRTLLLMRMVLVITLVLNYVAIVVTPAAVHHFAEIGDPNLIGNWRGVLPQKNFAGAICAFTILIFVFDAKRIPALFRLAVILATAYFLYRTSSKTSMGILVVAIAAGSLRLLYRPAYRAFMLPALALIAVGVTLYVNMNWDALVAPLNSQDALTGRVQIWPPLLNYANDHWLTGAGYGSFWNIGPYSPIYEYGRAAITAISTC